MKIINTYLKLIIVQMSIITLVIVVLTIVKYFDSAEYKKFINAYSFYSSYDTSTELVYQGKNN